MPSGQPGPPGSALAIINLDKGKAMKQRLQFYIDGKWVDPVTPRTLDVINPANEEPVGRISLGSKADVDKAVAAARRAFDTFSLTTRDERLALLQKVLEVSKNDGLKKQAQENLDRAEQRLKETAPKK